MNSNVQLNENYKFRMSYVLNFFKDIVSASEEVFDYLVSTLLKDFLSAHPEIMFERAFISDYDLKVSLMPDAKERGMFALSYHPSSSFANTRLWRVLFKCLEPTL